MSVDSAVSHITVAIVTLFKALFSVSSPVCACACSFLCRAVAIDEHHRVALLSLPVDAEIQLSSERASFFLVGRSHMTGPLISSSPEEFCYCCS